MQIEIYLRSITADLQSGARARSCVSSYAPAMMYGVSKQFYGRLLDMQSIALLYELEALLEQLDGDMRIYDASQVTGWLKYWLVGVRELPTVVVDGRIYSGFKAAKRALTALRTAEGGDNFSEFPRPDRKVHPD